MITSLKTTLGATFLAVALTAPIAAAQPAYDVDWGDDYCYSESFCFGQLRKPVDDTVYVDMSRPRINLHPLSNDLFIEMDLSTVRVEIDDVPEGYSVHRIDNETFEFRMSPAAIVSFTGVTIEYRVMIGDQDYGTAEIEILPLPKNLVGGPINHF